MQATIDRIRARDAERRYLLAVLELWAQAEKQGIDPETVEAFGYDPKLLTPQQKREVERKRQRTGIDPHTGKRLENGHYRSKVHNYVRFKDGSRVLLDPILKAVHKDDFE